MAKSPANLKVHVEHRFDSANLEHCHPNLVQDGSSFTVTACDYRFYSYLNSSVPDFAPKYEGPQDISCKMASEDKIATALGQAVPDMTAGEVMNKCSWLNQQAWAAAKDIISKSWPKALERFAKQGKSVTFKDDSQAFMGPQWVLTGLGFKETDTAVEIESEAIVSSVSSKIYPGSHYCKLLAPSKAVEFMISKGLMNRYKKGSAFKASQTATTVMI